MSTASRNIHRQKLEARFWPRVQRGDGCWLWIGSFFPEGYGQFWLAGRPEGAHRVSWLLTYGEITIGLCVLHNCPSGDNPACVNPAHLWLGTKGDNARDMAAKGRCRLQTHPELSPRVSLRGELNGRSKLTQEIAQEIRAYAAAGASQSALAKRFAVGQATVSRVINRAAQGGW